MNAFKSAGCLVLAMAVMAPTGAASQTPSFDCARASTSVEHAICASASLSRLDRELAAAYRDRKDRLGSAQRRALLADQRDWLARRDRCGADASCLARQMGNRIAALRSGTRTAPADVGGLAAGTAGHWQPYSDTSSPDGVRLSQGIADFGVQGRYQIEPVRPGGHVYRITGRSRGAAQLDCGNAPATYVAFIPAGKPVVGSGELLEVQFTAAARPMPEPRPSHRMEVLSGSCSMGYYIR